MGGQMAILTGLYLMCSVVYIFMGISTLLKDSKSKINKIFFIMGLTLYFWAIMLALLINSPNADTAAFYERMTTFCWSFLYYEFLYYCIYLTKKENTFKKLWQQLLLFLPAGITFCLYFFQPYTASDFTRTAYGWSILATQNRGLIWYCFFDTYYMLYVLAGLVLIYHWGKKSKFKRELKQSRIIVSSMVITALIGTITDVILPQFKIQLMPQITIISILISIGGIWYSISKYRLMGFTSESIIIDVLKIMDEGLIILNENGCIISVNNGALELLGYEEIEIKHKFASLVFSNIEDISKLNMCNSNSFEIDIKSKNNEKIPVLISSSVLLDNCGDKLGTVLIFNNIFEIKQIQNKLKDTNDNLEKRVQQRTCELSNVNKQLGKKINEGIAKEEKIIKLAYNYHLTGLPNRRSFYDKLNQAILDAVINKNSFVILFLDLDGFKTINDTMGHAQGDELLKKVAQRLTNIVSKSDVIARVGGDEFLILLYNPCSEQYIKKSCENIINTINEPFQFSNNEIYITTSIGVSIYPEDGSQVEDLVKNADIAMYKAKENGKGKYVLCNCLIKDNLDEVMKLTNDLYRALENNELELYYQPQVNTISGRIVGLEALLRWNHRSLGLLSPIVFIPIAEKTGLIVKIGEWVLKEACKQIKDWQDSYIPNLSIAVNLSVNQIQSHKIVNQVSRILDETGLNPQNLELEITENILMKDLNYIVDTLKKLKTLNVRIAIDDFGTDYSSLSYLKQLPLDRIKIPKCFIDGIGKNIADESIISSIIVLGKKLSLDLIAEGVETVGQLQFLKTQMCDEIQGFYYYKPMPVNEIEILFKSINTMDHDG